MPRQNKSRNADYWPSERQGYSDVRPQVSYANASSETLVEPKRARGLSPRAEALIADCIMAGGAAWFLHRAVLIGGFNALSIVGLIPPGPLETTAIGALIWLHAQWRRAVTIR